MRTKSFYGETLEEALGLAKKELGDPVIVKMEQKSGHGFLQRDMYEVIASLDGHVNNHRKRSGGGFKAVDEPGAGGFLVDGQTKPSAPIKRLPTAATQTPRPAPTAEPTEITTSTTTPPPSNKTLEDPEEIAAQIRELREMVGRTLQAAEMSGRSNRIKTPSGESADNWFSHFADRMANRGLDEDVIDLVARMALKRLSPEQARNPHLLNDFARQFIAYLLKDCGKINNHENEQQRIALVGPTGVGKTTTIAKMAADLLINKGLDVALITIDIYRIAAAEQLMVYGEIMNMPVDIAQTPDQLRQSLEKHRHRDVVLIDTAGRSANDSDAIEEMSKFFNPDFGFQVNLVLSATTRERELYRACTNFGRLRPSNIIFTKLDECEDYGTLLNFYLRKKIPISFLTNGQRVPEDFMPAEPEKTARMIVGA